MQNATNTQVSTDNAISTAPKAQATAAKGWAGEKARAIAGDGKAAKRFADLAQVLIEASLANETEISFDEANARAGLNRGKRGDAVNSWQLALQRTYQCAPDTPKFKVDADKMALVAVMFEATSTEAGE